MSATPLQVESDSQRTSGVTNPQFPTAGKVSFGWPIYIALIERGQAGEAIFHERLWSGHWAFPSESAIGVVSYTYAFTADADHWASPFVSDSGSGSPIILHGWQGIEGAFYGLVGISGSEWLVQSAEITSSAVGGSSTEGGSEPNLYTTILKEVLSEVEQRLGTHNGIVIEVRKIAREEAKTHHVRMLKINVRPSWSHEYDASHGVVIDVEMTGTPDERFSYWAAVSQRLEQLEDWLPSEGRDFLRENITFIVSRS